MILLKDKWLFVSTMKCCTNTLYKVLQKPEVGGKWAGRMAGDGQLFHDIPVTKMVSHPTPRRIRLAPIHWSCCRNPYDRAVSIWASVCLKPENQANYKPYSYILEQGGDPECFDDFVLHILIRQPQMRPPWLFRNQSDWQDMFICDLVIPVEELRLGLKEHFGLKYKGLPKLNPSPHSKWVNYYGNPGTRRLVEEWSGDDFERFGYETLRG